MSYCWASALTSSAFNTFPQTAPVTCSIHAVHVSTCEMFKCSTFINHTTRYILFKTIANFCTYVPHRCPALQQRPHHQHQDSVSFSLQHPWTMFEWSASTDYQSALVHLRHFICQTLKCHFVDNCRGPKSIEGRVPSAAYAEITPVVLHNSAVVKVQGLNKFTDTHSATEACCAISSSNP